MPLSLKDKSIINADINVPWGDQLEAQCKINVAFAKKLIHTNLLSKKVDFKSTKDQGDSLENVVNYFLAKSGLFSPPRSNFRSTVHQIDHHVIMRPHAHRVLSQIIRDARSLTLGESKNYSKKNQPLGVDVVYKVEGIKYRVGYFLGIYFTRGGVTGSEYTAATKLMYDFCNSQNTTSVVFSDEDWNFLYRSPKLFQRLLFAKIENFQVNNNFKVDYNVVSEWGS